MQVMRPGSDKIKLMHVIYSLDTGGLEKLVLELVDRVNHEIFQSSVCCLTAEGKLSAELVRKGISVFYMRKGGGIGYSIPFKIASLLRREKVDIVHTHDSSANLYGALAAKFAGVKGILNTEHGGIYFETKRKRVFNRILCLLNDREICVSNKVKEDLRGMHLSNKRLVVIPNGIDFTRFDIDVDADRKRSELGLKDSDFVITTVGRLSWEKNQMLLLESAAHILKDITEAKFIIVGDGALREKLEKRARNLGIADSAIFLGHREDIPEILKISNCFVNCSISESFGLTLVEAMMSDVPVVATDVGGVKEIVKNGETGLLVKSDDARALAEAVIRIKNGRGFAMRLVSNAKEWAGNNYDVNVMVRKYEEVYFASYRKAVHATIKPAALNILTFGIDDSALSDGDSHSKRWNSRTGSFVKRLDVIVEVKKWTNISEKKIADNVRIIPVHVPHPFLYSFIAYRKALELHRKVPYDLVTTEEPFRAGFAGWLFKKKTGVALSVEYHNDTFHNKSWLGERPVSHRVYIRLGKMVTRFADSIRCVNRKHSMELRRISKDPAKLIEIIPVPTEFYSYERDGHRAEEVRRDVMGGTEGLLILYVGRLVPIKKVDELIMAFADIRTKYKDVHLVIVGDGYDRKRLTNLTNKLGSERITFKGLLPEEEVFGYYGASDIFINPAHIEPYGRIYIEAMSAAKPIITTSGAGAVEDSLCIHNVNSLVIEPGDLDALKDSMIRLIEDGNLRKQLGENGLRTARQKFNYDMSIKKMRDFWERTISASMRGRYGIA